MGKHLRLIEFFAGYGSQHKALDYLDLKVESWKTCEWAVKSIQALKDLHFKDDNTDYSKDLTKEELIEYLSNKGISANYNEPMSLEQIKRLGEDKLRIIYNNIKATHNLVNIQQVKGSDLEIVDTDKYDYILTYSFPCQDLSNAGLGKGMSRDSGTRSGMLWEVERILKELKESNSPLPKYLLMENVPQVHGENNMQDFTDWCNFLKSIGYTNSWQDLNSKNFGIPQNRERTFMVSILDNDGMYFQFPQQIKLIFRLKDLLEKNVDEKYYLSDKALNGKLNSNYNCSKLENILPNEDGVTPTLCARDYKDPKCVQVAQIEGGFESNGRVYSPDGVSPTVTTCGGGDREPKIAEDYVGMYNYALSDTFMGDKDRFQEGKDVAGALLTSPKEGVVLNEPRICASRGRNPENPNSRESGQHTEQRLEIGPDGLSNTLTTVQKDNYVLEPQLEYLGSISEKDRVGDGKGLSRNSPQNDRVYDSNGIACTQTTGGINGLYKVEEKSSFTEAQKQMITEDGNVKRYLDSDIVDKFEVGDCADISFPNGYGKGNRVCKQCAPTITATGSKDNLVVKEGIDTNKIIELNDNPKHQQDLVQHEEGICRCIPAGTHGSTPHLLKTVVDENKEDNLKRQLCNHLIKEGLVKEGDVIRHSYTSCRMEDAKAANTDSPDCCSTLDTRCDTLGVVVNDEINVVGNYKPSGHSCGRIITTNGISPTVMENHGAVQAIVDEEIKNKRLHNLVEKTEFGDETMALDCYNQKTHDTCMQTITARYDNALNFVYNNYRIRKLTPKECWRLMGIKDKDYENVAENQSNASLYHLAGDSIVTTCLMAIFGKLFNVDYRAKIRKLLEDLNPNFDFSVIEPEVICERHNLLDDLLGDL